ncbi:DUF4262 domain-containing protein [Croceibacterium ferulae]|uniref:DUF4262 domain-containing protein n=1 Tax=Croceibacterium ferulae TaxID=1854641 RepID=UPI000EAF9B1C|nr:DUF4262 domain-containing protein [Croceibacterium ferulae]
MKTALDLDEAELNSADSDFLFKLQEHGWFSTRVFDPDKQEPDFTYSTGFFHGLGHPEIIVFSLPKQVSHDILWDLYRDIREGKVPEPGARLSGVFGNHQAVLLPVSRDFYAEHLGRSCWFYRGDNFPCLQLIWPDREGHFPWQSDFDPEFAGDQPDLTDGIWSGLTT